MGMSKETQDKIYENFFTTKPAGKGTGLGMSITNEIITKNHNGRILLESEPNVGTSFIFQIPVKTVK